MGQRYELSSFIDRILSDTHDFGLLGSRTVQNYKLKKFLDLVGISDKLRSLKHKVDMYNRGCLSPISDMFFGVFVTDVTH